MSEGLSEVGQARAWIHLALEKKMLSQHLKELLTNQELLRSGLTHKGLVWCFWVSFIGSLLIVTDLFPFLLVL